VSLAAAVMASTALVPGKTRYLGHHNSVSVNSCLVSVGDKTRETAECARAGPT
jgi:hypothetical protein